MITLYLSMDNGLPLYAHSDCCLACDLQSLYKLDEALFNNFAACPILDFSVTISARNSNISVAC